MNKNKKTYDKEDKKEEKEFDKYHSPVLAAQAVPSGLAIKSRFYK